ncbi:Alpha/Beta hydrolase protein [Cadophora sp. MPI-SDFR-AT-0126]|nr:Alpha/Beta hydrolase protein [Leotiomycetes sp. MPI-SDFR-AT-0126]
MSIPIRQKMAFLPEPTTGFSVTKFCSKADLRLPHEIVSLSNGTRLHIIGLSIESATNSKILLFFHGGAYFHSAAPSHIPFAYACSQLYSTPSQPAILAVLEYTLSPIAPYPRQLQQAIASLNYVLTLTSPSNIILVGDSAGGHLAMSLLSYMLHPDVVEDPSLESVQMKENENLRGLCLISPGLSIDLTGASYLTNSSTDYISSDTVHDMYSNLTPPSATLADALNIPHLSPGNAPAEHWSHLPVSETLVTIGEREVLYDSCLEFVEKLKQSGARVKLVIGEGEWHDSPIVDSMFGLKEIEGGTGQAVADWMREMGSVDRGN